MRQTSARTGRRHARDREVSGVQLIEIPNVLTDAQCDMLIDTFGGAVAPSLVGTPEMRTRSRARTSCSAKIEKTSLPLDVRQGLLERVAELSGLPVENQERWEILRYSAGEHFYPHYDFLPDLDARSPAAARSSLF